MPILFREEFVPLILSGAKTVTRRVGKRRWRIGAIHGCYTRPAFARPPGTPFARVRIVSVSWEAYVGASVARRTRGQEIEATREGFGNSWGGFLGTWRNMHGPGSLGQPCWRVEFALVEALP